MRLSSAAVDRTGTNLQGEMPRPRTTLSGVHPEHPRRRSRGRRSSIGCVHAQADEATMGRAAAQGGRALPADPARPRLDPPRPRRQGHRPDEGRRLRSRDASPGHHRRGGSPQARLLRPRTFRVSMSDEPTQSTARCSWGRPVHRYGQAWFHDSDRSLCVHGVTIARESIFSRFLKP